MIRIPTSPGISSEGRKEGLRRRRRVVL